MLFNKVRLCAWLAVGVFTHLVAQGVTIYTDNRWLVAQLPNHPTGYVTPSAPGADFNGYLNSFNSASDFYTASQVSTLSADQLVCNTYLNLAGALPPNSRASFGTYCSVNFGVSSATTGVFAFNNFLFSSDGFTFDGVLPSIGITSDDPNFNPNPTTDESTSESYVVDAFDNQSDGTVQFNFRPGYTYTFFEQMTGFGKYDPTGVQTIPLNVNLQVNMSLTMASNMTAVFVPEPSSILLFMVGGGIVMLWCIRRSRQMRPALVRSRKLSLREIL